MSVFQILPDAPTSPSAASTSAPSTPPSTPAPQSPPPSAAPHHADANKENEPPHIALSAPLSPQLALAKRSFKRKSPRKSPTLQRVPLQDITAIVARPARTHRPARLALRIVAPAALQPRKLAKTGCAILMR